MLPAQNALKIFVFINYYAENAKVLSCTPWEIDQDVNLQAGASVTTWRKKALQNKQKEAKLQFSYNKSLSSILRAF